MDVLRELQRHGIEIELVGNKLKLTPKHRVTGEVLELVRERKKELVEALRRPYINDAGILVIPSECNEKYRWWTSKGQNIQATLAELGAPPEIIVKYVSQEGTA